MQTTTETILLITVWTLTCTGLFFGLRAKLRKRREKKRKGATKNNSASTED